MEADFSIEGLLAFLDGLPESFSKAPSQRLVVRELILRLLDCEGMPRDRDALRTLLAPVVCTTAEQQKEFYDRFEEWARPKLTETTEFSQPRTGTRRLPWVAVAAMVLLGLGAAGYEYLFRPVPPPPRPQTPGLPSEDSPIKSDAGPASSIQVEVQAPKGVPEIPEKTDLRLPVRAPVQSRQKNVDPQGKLKFQIALLAATTQESSTSAINSPTLININTILESNVESIAFSPDGRRLATGSTDHTARIWDAATGKELLTLRGHKLPVTSVAFSPDGGRLVTGSDDGTATIWDAENGRKLITLGQHAGVNWPYNSITSVAFSLDGTRLATGSNDATARIYDAATGKELLTLRGHKLPVTSVAFSPDGRRLVTGSNDDTAKIWDAENGKELITLRGHGDVGYSGIVNSVAFSPDGKRLATGSYDYTAKIWDAQSGEELMTMRGHTSEVWSVSFSPDGRRLATGSSDHTARIWDTETGKELITLGGLTDSISPVAFSPDGRRLATVGDVGVKIWDLERRSSESGGPSARDAQKLSLLVTNPDYEPAYIENVYPGSYVYSRLGTPRSSARAFFQQRLIPPRRYSIWVSAFIGMALACAGLITFLTLRRRLKQLQAMLEKWETHLDLSPILLHSRSEEDLLFARPEFAALAVRLRRPNAEPASGLAIDQTVRRTIEHAGLFTPVKRMRKAGREYLALLQSTGRYDQRARFWKCFLKRMEMRDVWLDSYQFSGDPRRCRAADGGLAVTRLEEVASVYPHHALWVVTETERFFDRNTREPAPWVPDLARWQDRSVVGLTEGTDADRRELDQLGFGFATGNPLELGRLGEAGGQFRFETYDSAYPRALIEEETLWLHGPQPRGASGRRAMRSLNRQLRLWLGRDGYRCLLACAIYPGLAWNLTLHWSVRLIPQEKLEETLGNLLRLPWFRYSRMPQWLREFLLIQLPPEDHDEFLKILQEFLKAKQETQPRDTDPSLEILRITERMKAEDQPPTRDYVFLSFLLGNRPRRWRLPAPEWLRQLLFPEGFGQLGIRPVYWLLLGLLGGGLAFAGSEHFARPRLNTMPEVWREIPLPHAKPIRPANELSSCALEIAATRLGTVPPADFTNWAYEQAANFAGEPGDRRVGEERPGAIFVPESKVEQPGLVEQVADKGLVLIQPFHGKLSRVYRSNEELQGRFEEVVESPAVLFEEYDAHSGVFRPLLYGWQSEIVNGTLKSTGPQYKHERGFPYVMYDNTRKTLFLHPGTFQTSNLGAVTTLQIPENGTYSIVGAFARANDLKGQGDGVRVLIFLGNRPNKPLFDSLISSQNDVDEKDFFSGRGVTKFDLRTSLKRGDELHFAVLSGPQLADGTFDFTALRFKVSDGHTSISMPENFPKRP